MRIFWIGLLFKDSPKSSSGFKGDSASHKGHCNTPSNTSTKIQLKQM